MSKQHCRTLQFEQMLLRHCCWCGQGLSDVKIEIYYVRSGGETVYYIVEMCGGRQPLRVPSSSSPNYGHRAIIILPAAVTDTNIGAHARGNTDTSFLGLELREPATVNH